MSSHYFCYQSLIHGQSKSFVFCVLNDAKNLKRTEVAIPVIDCCKAHVTKVTLTVCTLQEFLQPQFLVLSFAALIFF